MKFSELKKYMISELFSELEHLKENGTIKDEENFSPSFDISIVLRDIFKLSKTDYLIGKDFTVSENDYSKALQALNDLKALKPVQYITGKCEFMSLEFIVNENTLIPRPDTEILVEYILNHFKQNSNRELRILDIGTGSGCIAVSLVHYLKNARAVCIDISEEALSVAEENAKAHKLSDKITFLRHNILSGFPKSDFEFDCIVSNPPYIETSVVSTLEENVKGYEPISALDGGKDGLIFYREIINSCKLKKGGLLAFEIGYNQGGTVSELFNKSGRFKDIEITKDLSGNDRVVSAVFTGGIMNNNPCNTE